MGCCNKNACGCYINAGENITITGDGSVGNPFTINTTDPGAYLTQVHYTNTNCITFTGLGTVASPLVPHLILDPDSPLPISCGSAGLRIELDACSEIMCDINGVPQGSREDTPTGIEYYDLNHHSLGTTLPSGWYDCGACTD